ncbi:MAG TPA: aminotransferase class IV [Actinomycetes bacterium]|nr:aminotransferase class IV [Actinomycetes bacterium]
MRIWVNDRLVDEADAVVSVLDHGLTVGDGVFETVKVLGSTPFALTRHLRRLAGSALGLGLPAPSDRAVRSAIEAVLDANAYGALGRLRITYTAGVAPLGSERGTNGPTLVIAVVPMAEPSATTSVVTVPWPRNEHSALAGLKTTSYAENVIALARAHAVGATEALASNTAGELCEGTGSNIFVVLDGQVVTPPLASGCLAGVTRDLLLEWSDAAELTVPMSALTEASEIFLTSTTRDVQGVSAVDGRALLADPVAPGPVTAKLRAMFVARASEQTDP